MVSGAKVVSIRGDADGSITGGEGGPSSNAAGHKNNPAFLWKR